MPTTKQPAPSETPQPPAEQPKTVPIEHVASVAAVLDLPPTVHVALQRVAQEVGAIAKDREVKEGPARFKFRGIDDVLDTIHEPMAKHGVSFIPSGFDILDQSERDRGVDQKGTPRAPQVHLLVIAHFRIVGPQGDEIPAAVLAEALDTSDKAASKAMSMAYKYLAFEVLSIPVKGALDESDQDSSERVSAQQSLLDRAAPRVTSAELHAQLTVLATKAGTDFDGITAKYREQQGGISVEDFKALPAERIYGFVRQVKDYVDGQQQKPEANAYGDGADFGREEAAHQAAERADA